MHVTQTKSVVSFVGHDQGEKATYRLKLKTESDAADLKAAIDKELAEVAIDIAVLREQWDLQQAAQLSVRNHKSR